MSHDHIGHVGMDGMPMPMHQKSSLGLRLTMMSMYMLSMCTSYLLMLAVMTFNVGYFFPVVMGLGLAYFLCKGTLPGKTLRNVGYFFAVVIGLGLGYFVFYESGTLGTLIRSDSCHGRLQEEF
eukprot:gene14585-20634_t